jgi:glycosyltransferase involved in cell wall biosynthesis
MRDDLPLVCICIPTYNAGATIRETLESILAQAYPNLVIHVSDNASTDDTLKIVASMPDVRVRIHRQEKNIGAEGNFNRCIQLAEGRYTAIFHADDVYEPDMVAKQVAFLEAHPEAGAVFTEACLIDSAGTKVGEIRLPQGISSQCGLYDFEIMFKAVLRRANFFVCPSFMICTRILQQEIKVWRGELFGSGADLDVWLRILQNHQIGHIPERLIRYRISNNQFSSRVRMETEAGIIFKIIDHYLEQVQVQAMLNTKDLLNYKWLERRDRVGRAVNLFLMDRYQEAVQLLDDLYTWDALRAAFQSKRGIFVLIVGAYVRLLAALGLNKFGKLSLTYLKQVSHR